VGTGWREEIRTFRIAVDGSGVDSLPYNTYHRFYQLQSVLRSLNTLLIV
jgi:hypothetical protein